MRRAAISGLRWKNVDLENGRIKIYEILHRITKPISVMQSNRDLGKSRPASARHQIPTGNQKDRVE
jgi:hypothetical protein